MINSFVSHGSKSSWFNKTFKPDTLLHLLYRNRLHFYATAIILRSRVTCELLNKLVRSRWLDIDQVLLERDGVEVHQFAKKERSQYSVILTEHIWSIKDLLRYGFRDKFFLRDKAGSPERLGSQSQRRICRFILPAHVASHIIK